MKKQDDRDFDNYFVIDDIEYRLDFNIKKTRVIIRRYDRKPIENVRLVCEKFLLANGWKKEQMDGMCIDYLIGNMVNIIVHPKEFHRIY